MPHVARLLAVLALVIAAGVAASACGGGATQRPAAGDGGGAADAAEAAAQLDAPGFTLDGSAPDDVLAPPLDTTPPPPLPLGPPGDWRLIFADEFDGAALDEATWNRAYPWSPTVIHNELQYYAPDDVIVDGSGVLKLKAERRSLGGQAYTSGVVASWGKFQLTYGAVEARLKLPAGAGLWPSFWLVPRVGAAPPEIDVMMASGLDPHSVVMNFTWGADPLSSGTWHTDPAVDFTADFHVFTMTWSATELIWYLDGVERKRYSTAANVPQAAMYLILSLAVGSGGFTGTPDATTPFPSYLTVDYVRAWQR
ncbi:MAG TPA: glycoside hydrolase family 16 protein [Polyangia bacterium]|jgi:beta-glucanase (GH16 family)